MNTTKNRLIQKLLLNKKAKKQNGFTLIELMVVVAIVGILSAVGLPELTKAQNRAKDTTALATLTNAAKECSINLLTLDAATAKSEFAAATSEATEASGSDPNAAGYTGPEPAGSFAGVVGDCEESTTLGLASEGNADGDGYQVTFNFSVPGVAVDATADELTAIAG